MVEMKERAERLNEILESRGSEFYLKFTEIWKNNEMLESYMIVPVDESWNCSPMVYRDTWYNDSDDAVVDFLVDVFCKNRFRFDLNIVKDPDFIRANIYPRLVSANSNIELLKKKDIAFVPFLDLLVLFYIDVSTVFRIGDEQGDYSVQLSYNLLHSSGISLDDAFSWAIDNASAKVIVKSMNDVLQDMAVQMEVSLDDILDGNIPMYVVSNESQHYGAVSILCADAIAQIRCVVGNHFVILPSSIHECIVLPFPEDGNIDELRDMVRCVNDTDVIPQEVLSYSLYSCDEAGHLYQL